MEKKRFKMYKKGKSWVIAPIIFLGILVATDLAVDKNEAYAAVETAQIQQVAEDVPIESTTNEAVEQPVGGESETSHEDLVISDQTKSAEENEPQPVVTEQPETAVNAETKTDIEPDKEIDKEIQAPKEAVTEVSTEEVADETVSTESTVEGSKAETTSDSENKPEAPTNDSTKAVENQTVQSSNKAATQSSAATARSAAAKAAKIAIYRVYNPNSGEHLHTMNAGERDYLVRLGWRNEGISMYVDGTGNQLYRLYNPNSGEHFYTLVAGERDNLKKHGWRYEGIAWKTPKTGQPMYRVFNPNARGAGSHHYTMLVSERNDLVKRGWRNEGIAWYTAGGSQSVASYILLNAPYINQNGAGFPMGCEAASLLQALQQKGYAKNYNLKNFIKEMPMSPNNNPNNGFSGRPDVIKPNIYHSIYAKPLTQWGNKYGKVADISGSSVETLKDELRKGNPVVVYVTGNYASPRYGKYWWGTGIDNAHVVTLDGFNESNNTYHISDPNSGKYWVSASKFEASYNLRKSAVVVR